MINNYMHQLEIVRKWQNKIGTQRGMCIKGLNWPLLEPKLKVACHQFDLIGLLEE